MYKSLVRDTNLFLLLHIQSPDHMWLRGQVASLNGMYQTTWTSLSVKTTAFGTILLTDLSTHTQKIKNKKKDQGQKASSSCSSAKTTK